MEKNQAIEVLVKVAHLAQKNGLLQLQDAVIVSNAIEVVTKKEENQDVAE
jgi:uncharacterized membrane protein